MTNSLPHADLNYSDDPTPNGIRISDTTKETVDRYLQSIQEARASQTLGAAAVNLETILDTTLTTAEEAAGHTEDDNGAPAAIDTFALEHPATDEPTSTQ